MTDKELLYALVCDRIKLCVDNYMITNTNFLDSFQQSDIVKYFKKNCPVKYEFYGGFDDAERRMIVFLPDYIESIDYFNTNSNDNPIKPVKIIKDNFSTLSHRDYLGAIMGLGIKREMIGDIILNEHGCSLAVADSVSKYICENLVSVGRGSVKADTAECFDEIKTEEVFEEKRCFVSSMRADSVVSAGFGLSRSSATEKILHGDVIVNSVIITKPDAHISFGSKIVIHGKGKIVVTQDGGITKKGRHTFIIKKFS